MANKIFDNFLMQDERENPKTVIENIDFGTVFRGATLWVLVFAIFIASLGLNINSTAVIIGAMLVSPLMGPIMGLGLSLGINDLKLFKKSLRNYLIATFVGLAASAIYFSISPLNEAHSELLARTSPTIYDVLIAIFGGLSGIVAAASTKKGNVIPGVAIATALMPPLCTAGFGLATWHMNYLFGALYLYTINSVFIAISTFAIVRLLKFPRKHLEDKRAEVRSHRILVVIAILTLLPSLYFGYTLVQEDRFTQMANAFIENESKTEGDYLLSKQIDPREQTITLIYGGKEISPEQIDQLRSRLKIYGLEKANLIVQQGFAFLEENKETSQVNQLTQAVAKKELEVQRLKNSLDSVSAQQKLAQQIFKELKTQTPEVTSFTIQPATEFTDSSSKKMYIAAIKLTKKIPNDQQQKIQDWLKVRLQTQSIKFFFEE